MRRFVLIFSLLGSLIAPGCAPADMDDSTDSRTAEAQSPIAYGMQDTKHTAVVSLLANAGGGSFTECSGSIVQQKNGYAYVLTAAHCCTDGAPSLVVQASDYGNYAGYLGSSNPPPPAYKVAPNSAYYDSQFDGSPNGLQNGHDFCMLKFAVSTAMPTLTLPSQATCTNHSDITANAQVEHVGFGMTDQNPNNSQRRTGTNTVNAGINSVLIKYTQGNGTPGPCEGDSGGPALTPPGATQSAQTIVGVTSFGNSASCAGSTVGASARVCSEIGAGKFITEFLNDNPTAGGTPAGMAASNCGTCQDSALSPGGACASTYNTCANTPACVTLLNCLGNCQDQTCVNNCWTAAGTTGQNAYNNIANCICNTGCATECATECGGSTSSSSSSSSGGMTSACGFQGEPTCINCISGSCCNQASACAGSQTCVDCLNNPTTACNSNSQYVGFAQCLQNNCNAECLGGSSSSSSSTSSSGNTSTSSSSGGNTSTSSSTSAGGIVTSSSGGAGGAGSGGAGSGGDGNGNGDNNQESGCSVGAAGSDTGSAASLAGMLLGLAIAASRRRRAR